MNPKGAVKLPRSQGLNRLSSNVELYVSLDPLLPLSVYCDPEGGTFAGPNLQAEGLCRRGHCLDTPPQPNWAGRQQDHIVSEGQVAEASSDQVDAEFFWGQQTGPSQESY